MNVASTVVQLIDFEVVFAPDVHGGFNGLPLEFSGSLRHSHSEPILIGDQAGGSPLKLGYRVLPDPDTIQSLFEDRIAISPNRLEPDRAYPFRIRVPQQLGEHDQFALRVEFIQEGSYWFSERGGQAKTFVVERAGSSLRVRPSWQSVELAQTEPQPMPIESGGRAREPDLPTRLETTPQPWSLASDPKYLSRPRHFISCDLVQRSQMLARHVQTSLSDASLAVADRIRASGTVPSRFFTDAMAAVWLTHTELQQRFADLSDEICLYAYLGWYLCDRPIESGMGWSSEPTEIILAEMAVVDVASDAESGETCTALMIAAYRYAVAYAERAIAYPPPPDPAKIIEWFFCDAVYDLAIFHVVPQQVRTRLGQPAKHDVSKPAQWVMQRLPIADAAHQASGPWQARLLQLVTKRPRDSRRYAHLLRETLAAAGNLHVDGPAAPAVPAACARLGAAIIDSTTFMLADGEAEYTCLAGGGLRLLLREEWYGAERNFVWSRAPIATLLFTLPDQKCDWFRLGLLLTTDPAPSRQLRVLVNHNELWSGTITEATADELILSGSGQCLAQGLPNILQFEVTPAFVPAQHGMSSDHRTLGISLRRVWVRAAWAEQPQHRRGARHAH